MDPIPLARPDISSLERSYVAQVLQTPQLSLGPKIPLFERAVAAVTGLPHAVAVNSGTSALHLIVRSLDLRDGDEVITSPFTFIATAEAIALAKSLKFQSGQITLSDGLAKLTLGVEPSLIFVFSL